MNIFFSRGKWHRRVQQNANQMISGVGEEVEPQPGDTFFYGLCDAGYKADLQARGLQSYAEVVAMDSAYTLCKIEGRD